MHSTDCLIPGSQPAQYMQRSALGLTRVYNGVPECIRREKTVSAFQTALQNLIKELAMSDKQHWKFHLSPPARKRELGI